ncbi:rod shape-determining protein RodA [Candidatus Gottesmanbacteria bacterium]|nr:rod shape-determining protein RodA [Candidatus Gottesmanbacteria bacterium]
MGREAFHFDWITALILLVLASFGLFLLLTINQSLFLQQLFFVVLGIGFLYLFSRLDGLLLWWAGPWAYIVANILLAVSYFGPSIRGATRWIMVGPIQLQPSELVKPLLILAFARFISQYPPRDKRNILIHLGLFILPFFLVVRQPDIGSSIVYTSFWFAMMMAGGLSLAIVLLAGLVIGLIFPLVWHWLAGYQKARILTFLEPGLDPKGAGYNALQSMIAVGSGQWFGRGLGRGTQSHLRFLPEYHTDFIFATLVEDLGFLGGITLLGMYAILLWRILVTLLRERTESLFAFAFSIGLFAMILSQIFIHAGMNMGILPITGITLPFISYGGSSILALSTSFGLWWAIRRGESGSVANMSSD